MAMERGEGGGMIKWKMIDKCREVTTKFIKNRRGGGEEPRVGPWKWN